MIKTRTFLVILGLVTGLSANASAPRCGGLMDLLTAKAAPAKTEVKKVVPDENAILAELQAQEKSIFRVNMQHFLERSIRILQRHVTAKTIRSSTAIQQRRRLQLIHLLNEGKHNEAIDLFRKTFDDVELAFHMIKSDEAALQNSSLNLLNKLKLQKRHFFNQRKFAHNYGEYLGTRSYLEKAISDEKLPESFRNTAELTLRYLGARKFSKDHPEYAALNIPKERPEIGQIRALFNSSGRYTRLMLWKDFRNEIFRVAKYFVSSEVIVQGVDNFFNRLPVPPHVADAIKKFTFLLGSVQLRNRHIPLLVEIESLPENAGLRLEALRSKNASTRNDELLVTYVRTVEFTDSWNAHKAEAEKRVKADSKNTALKNFYDRMLAAETRAAKLEDVSIFENTASLDVMLRVVQVGVLLKYYGPENFNSLSEWMSFFSNPAIWI
jgi:hypothetical protein